MEKILMKKRFPHGLPTTSLMIFCCLSLIFAHRAFAWQSPGAATKALSGLSAAESEAAATLKAETIREVTEALASEPMQGRGTAQPGGDKAAQYIAERFSKLGLKPLGDNSSFLQKVNFKETLILAESSIKAGGEQLKYGSDFVISPPYTGDKTVSGSIAFVAFGMETTTPKRNDLSSIDFNGKIVLLLEGPPKMINKEAWDKSEIQSTTIRFLAARGAKAILIANAGSQRMPYAQLADHLTRRQLRPGDEADLPSAIPPFAYLSNDGAERLFSGSGITYAEALAKAERGEAVSQILKKPATISVRLKKGKGAASNVVGFLEGSDPVLKEEAVVYTAHYDAYGIGADGRIYPGAADNALGVGEMIAIAESFKKLATPPRRSVLFLAVTGEEYGLLGTEHWIKNPTWKLKKIAANLNFDGIGTEVYGPLKRVVGFGAEHSDLNAVLKDVLTPLAVDLIPDPLPEEKVFTRSDHYAFVKRGIPALMLLGAPDGEQKKWLDRSAAWRLTDYHQPTDTVRPEWDWQGPRTLSVIGFLVGYRVANATDMPKWYSSSPFNRSRGSSESVKN
jgi:Zn-dependent M28 family amino/carboxypeptidase